MFCNPANVNVFVVETIYMSNDVFEEICKNHYCLPIMIQFIRSILAKNGPYILFKHDVDKNSILRLPFTTEARHIRLLNNSSNLSCGKCMPIAKMYSQ